MRRSACLPALEQLSMAIVRRLLVTNRFRILENMLVPVSCGPTYNRCNLSLGGLQ
jgi:hypothetical protein